MFRQLLALAMFSSSSTALADTCVGPADDGTETFTVTVERGSDGKAQSLVFTSDAEPGFRRFDAFTDITPRAPTDERFRYVFHDGEPAPGELAIMVLEGGFTQLLSAQIWLLGEEGTEPTALGTLNCPH